MLKGVKFIANHEHISNLQNSVHFTMNISLLCRLHNMETTMLSLATLPRAPPAALYNPLEHGHHLTEHQVVKVRGRLTL